MRSVRPAILLCGVTLLVACDRFGGGSGGAKSSDRATTLSPAEFVARACANVDPSRIPDAEPRDGYTTVDQRDSLLRILEAAEEKWRATRPAGYTMTVVAACFCRDRGMPIVLRVAADSVIASRDTTGQQSWPDDWRTALHVAGLFNDARQATCDSTRTTRVTFDPSLGYPTLLRTESRLEMSDTDREYRVLAFSADQ